MRGHSEPRIAIATARRTALHTVLSVLAVVALECESAHLGGEQHSIGFVHDAFIGGESLLRVLQELEPRGSPFFHLRRPNNACGETSWYAPTYYASFKSILS